VIWAPHETDQSELDFGPLYLATVGALSISFSVASLILFFRMQLQTHAPAVVITIFCLAGAFILLPTILCSSGKLTQNLIASLPVVAVIALAMLVCAAGSFLAPRIAIYPVLLGIWFVGIRTLAKANVAPRQYLAAIVIGLFLGVQYFFILNSLGYANVFSPESVVLGFARLDTLFHSAIAALFSRYGVVSTGLDGLVPIHYHALSHLLFGRIALWLNVSSIDIYAVAPQIIGIPFLIFAVAFAVFALWRPVEPVKAPLALLVFPLTFMSLVETNDWHSYLVSESYLLALGLFLLTIPLLRRLSQLRRVLESPACLFGAVLTTLVVAGTKVSVGFVLATAVSAAVSMALLPRKAFLYLVGVGILSTNCFLLWVLLGKHSPNGLFEFGAFFDEYPLVAYLNMGVTTLGIAVLGFCATVDIRYRRIVVVLALAALASFISALLLNVAGGAQYYFINVGVWIAAVATCGFLLLPFINRVDCAATATAIAGIIFIVAIIITPQKAGSVQAFFELAAKVENIAHERSHSRSSINRYEFALATIPAVIAKLHKVPEDIGETYVERLRQTIERQLPPERKRIALFIPPGETEVWHMQEDCRASGFVFPGLLGIPMINGVPSNCADQYYSFSYYGDEAKNREIQDQELCRRAQRLDIDRVIKVITASTVQNLDCSSRE
jgi:hypothetical protein